MGRGLERLQDGSRRLGVREALRERYANDEAARATRRRVSGGAAASRERTCARGSCGVALLLREHVHVEREGLGRREAELNVQVPPRQPERSGARFGERQVVRGRHLAAHHEDALADGLVDGLLHVAALLGVLPVIAREEAQDLEVRLLEQVREHAARCVGRARPNECELPTSPHSAGAPHFRAHSHPRFCVCCCAPGPLRGRHVAPARARNFPARRQPSPTRHAGCTLLGPLASPPTR